MYRRSLSLTSVVNIAFGGHLMHKMIGDFELWDLDGVLLSEISNVITAKISERHSALSCDPSKIIIYAEPGYGDPPYFGIYYVDDESRTEKEELHGSKD